MAARDRIDAGSCPQPAEAEVVQGSQAGGAQGAEVWSRRVAVWSWVRPGRADGPRTGRPHGLAQQVKTAPQGSGRPCRHAEGKGRVKLREGGDPATRSSWVTSHEAQGVGAMWGSV